MEEIIQDLDLVNLLDLKNNWYLVVADYKKIIPISECYLRFVQTDLNLSEQHNDYYLVEIKTNHDLESLSKLNEKSSIGYNTYLNECFITNWDKKVVFKTQLVPFESNQYVLFKYFNLQCTFTSKFKEVVHTKTSIEDKILILEQSDWHKEAKKRIENETQLRLNQKLALKLLKYKKENNLTDNEISKMIDIDIISLQKLFKSTLNVKMSTFKKIEKIINEKIL